MTIRSRSSASPGLPASRAIHERARRRRTAPRLPHPQPVARGRRRACKGSLVPCPVAASTQFSRRARCCTAQSDGAVPGRSQAAASPPAASGSFTPARIAHHQAGEQDRSLGHLHPRFVARSQVASSVSICFGVGRRPCSIWRRSGPETALQSVSRSSRFAVVEQRDVLVSPGRHRRPSRHWWHRQSQLSSLRSRTSHSRVARQRAHPRAVAHTRAAVGAARAGGVGQVGHHAPTTTPRCTVTSAKPEHQAQREHAQRSGCPRAASNSSSFMSPSLAECASTASPAETCAGCPSRRRAP